jgi:small multidrug resistance family-3 protein
MRQQKPLECCMRAPVIYAAAAVAEIAGCYGFWVWLRLGRSFWWAGFGVVSLIVFAWLLTLVPVEHAGRAYAIYGGVYIAATLVWLRVVEDFGPDRWDLIGATIALAGAAVILWGPRGA